MIKRLVDLLLGSGSQHPLHQPPIIPTSNPNFGPEPDPATLPEPIHRKVMMITHNPVLHTQGGRTVREYFRWNDSDELAAKYIEDVRWASYGYANYEIVKRIEVDAYPVKRDGFKYDEHSYLKAWRTRKFHDPDGVDYLRLVDEFDMIPLIDSGEIDEVWLFGHPYGGYYESIMCGPDAFWCNAPPLKGTEHAYRRFVIMGFNFERGVGEMLEDLGHRAESMMFKVYGGMRGQKNLWEKFLRIEKDHPGKAEVGSVHFSPNSVRDYDWGNPRRVMSRCDTWYNFPDLSGDPRPVDFSEWGSGDIRLHHLWWFRHFPHILGDTDGVSNNWWQYVIDPSTVR